MMMQGNGATAAPRDFDQHASARGNAHWSGGAPKLSVLIPFFRHDPSGLIRGLERQLLRRIGNATRQEKSRVDRIPRSTQLPAPLTPVMPPGSPREAPRWLAHTRADVAAWRRLVEAVRRTIEVMPLWKLRAVGGQSMDLLYPNVGEGNVIELRPGIAYCFRRFHELVDDIVRGAWVRFVRALPANQPALGQVTEVSTFLFGAAREEVDACRPVLMEVQHGRCFDCEDRLREDGVVEHFVPWSRYPVDLGHNYVLAHATCIGAKPDRLAAPVHLSRWCTRNEQAGADLAAEFARRGVAQDLAITRRIAGWAYGQAEATAAQVWVRKDELVGLGTEWRKHLAAA